MAGPDGYLGLGCDRYCERTVAYWSSDGSRWTQDTGFPKRFIEGRSAATSGDTLVTIGDTLADQSDVVTFTDGRWAVLDVPLPPAPDGEWVSITDVAALPDGGFAIVGAFERPNHTTGPFLLASPDGVAWEPSPVALDPGVERLWVDPHAIAAGPGVVALEVSLSGKSAGQLDLDGENAIAWSSAADDWRLATLPLPSGATEAVVRDMMVASDGRVIVVGETSGARSADRAAIWVGTLEGRATARATPEPSPDPTVPGTASPEATPGTRGERIRQEDVLLDLAGFASCSPYRARGDFDPFQFGAAAAVRCERPAPGIRQVALFQFPDTASVDDYWSYRIESLESPLEVTDGACQEGGGGRATWAHGRVACYVSPASRKAKLRWTDERTNTYWLADAEHRDVTRLARWWRENRPLRSVRSGAACTRQARK